MKLAFFALSFVYLCAEKTHTLRQAHRLDFLDRFDFLLLDFLFFFEPRYASPRHTGTPLSHVPLQYVLPRKVNESSPLSSASNFARLKAWRWSM